MRGNRTGKGWFVKGRRSANPAGRPKNPPVLATEYAPDLTAAADRRVIRNVVAEARRFSGLAVDTLVELTKDTHTDLTRYAADRRTVGNLVVEARKFSGLAVDTLVELTKNTHMEFTFQPMRSRNGSAT